MPIYFILLFFKNKEKEEQTQTFYSFDQFMKVQMKENPKFWKKLIKESKIKKKNP